MADYSYLEHWADKATWSLEQAALLVNEIDPDLPPIPTFEPESASPASRVFFWLKKEWQKGTLSSVTKSDSGEPLFSPGTLVRRLVERGKHTISARLRKAVERPESAPGPSKRNRKAKLRFLHAAQLIWEDHPHMTAKKMAEWLEKLPSFVHSDRLPSFSRITIRKYLIGRGPHAAGRPSERSQRSAHIDLVSYAKRI